MRLMSLYFSTIQQLVEGTPRSFTTYATYKQGPFKVVEVLGPYVYRIVDCANPKRQKVVHFNRLKPGPEKAEAPPPEITLGPSTPRQPTDPLDALPNGVGEQNVMKIPLLTLQLVITMKIFNLPLYQWRMRIDNLSLGQLQMFQGQDAQPESEGLACTTVIQLKFLRPYKMKISLVEKAV